MTTESLKIGNQYQHYNGYIWTVTSLVNNVIHLESKNQTDGQVIKGSMTAKDLQAIIKAGYYKAI